MPLSCRFYAEKYPEIEDTVMVNVRSVAEMGAYVSLLEYNNIEGMILLSELSRRRIRSVNKLIRVGRNECVVVIRVDKEKGYIDLSKRRVYMKDLIQCDERFAKAKAVNSILRHVAERLDYTEDSQLEELYEKTAWYFDKKYKKKAAAYDIFRKATSDNTVLDECNLDENTKNILLEDIRKRLTPQAVKIRADIDVSCFAYEGIDAVKNALMEGIKCSTEDMPIKVCELRPIKINLIAPPQYVVTTNTLEREEGLLAVNRALERIKSSIEAGGGTFKIVMAAKVVTDLDEKEIERRMELLELEGAEVLGDSDEDNEEGMTAPADLDRQVDLEKETTKEQEDEEEEDKDD